VVDDDVASARVLFHDRLPLQLETVV
jgi:hypothetical protein